MTIGQETRWAYSTMLPSVHGAYKGKGLSTCYSAAYMRRLVNNSALHSWKWQLIGMS